MKQVHGMIGIIMMLLLTIMVPQVQLGKIAHAATTYEISKTGYEKWLSDNASRKVTCPIDNLKGNDKLGMFYCQCSSWLVFNLLQSGISEDFIRNLGLGNAGTWADNSNVKPFVIKDVATTQKWATFIYARWARVNDGVESFKFISFGSSAPLVLEVVYKKRYTDKNGQLQKQGHVMIVDSVTNPVMNVTDYNGNKTGDYDSFQFVATEVRPTITFPGNGHVFRDAWSFTWNNASTSNFFKICRDGNSNECVVSEQRSGGSYQSNSASWAKQQTGKWCATVGVTSTGPWSTAVCFTMSAPRITSPTANQQVRGFWQINWVGDGTIFQMCTDSSFNNCLVNQPVSGGVYRAQSEAWARIQRGNYCARVGVTSNGPWSDTVCFNVDNTISVGGGLYRISSAGTNLSLDVKDRRDEDGKIIQIWAFTGSGGSNQKWRFESRGNGFYAIRTAMSSKRCLDVKGNSQDNGRNLQIWKCHFDANQQFRVVDMGGGRVVIVARHSGKVFDVKGGVKEIKNGTIVQQYDVHGQRNQLWDIVQVP
jgi:hypothetical protein